MTLGASPLSASPLSASAEVVQVTTSASLPIVVSIVPAAILSGAQSVCIGDGHAAVWTVIVILDGADITAQTLGEIRVEAEENAARIAEFVIRPPADTELSLAGWTGRNVTIDVADNSTGVPRWPMRLFTGVVDTPSLDIERGTIALSCTDDLQGRCYAMTQATLAALIGGYYSPAVFDDSALGWEYAQDRLSTRPASLDISPYGAMRVTDWAPKTTPDFVLDATLVLDQSLSVSLPSRSSLTNEINIDFGYRFPRMKAEGHLITYEAVNMTGFAQFVLDGKSFMQRAQVEAALSKAGATIDAIAYTPLPDEIIPVGAGYWTPGPYDSLLCMAFSATVSFDFAATIEEQHAIRVFTQKSIDAVGLRQASMSGALEGVYTDIVAAETNVKLYKDDTSRIPPADQAAVLAGKTTSVDATLTSETNRAAANAAMETLIAIGKARIWASHRNAAVSCAVPMMPALDLDKTVEIDSDGVHARGKCRQVIHRMNTDSGQAITEIDVAICSVAGVGITHNETATSAPAGTSGAATDIVTPPVVTYNAAVGTDHVITIDFASVAEAERNPEAVVLAAEYAAPIVEDLLTVTL